MITGQPKTHIVDLLGKVYSPPLSALGLPM